MDSAVIALGKLLALLLLEPLWRKLSGMRDTESGYSELDRNFVIRGNDESKVRALFANPRIRQLIQAQPFLNFQVKAGELQFEAPLVITDVEWLKSLYELFVETLNQLWQIGSASPEDPMSK